MEICSPKMWKSSSTRRTETLSRGGCCCRREFLVPSSDERVTSRSETWASWSHTAWRCSGDRRRHVAVSSHHSRRWYQHVWRSSEPAIRGCVRSALDIARQRGYRSIAFPLIGAGTGGFSPDRALEIMQDEARQIDYDGEVRFVRFSMEFFPNKE